MRFAVVNELGAVGPYAYGAGRHGKCAVVYYQIIIFGYFFSLGVLYRERKNIFVFAREHAFGYLGNLRCFAVGKERGTLGFENDEPVAVVRGVIVNLRIVRGENAYRAFIDREFAVFRIDKRIIFGYFVSVRIENFKQYGIVGFACGFLCGRLNNFNAVPLRERELFIKRIIVAGKLDSVVSFTRAARGYIDGAFFDRKFTGYYIEVVIARNVDNPAVQIF